MQIMRKSIPTSAWGHPPAVPTLQRYGLNFSYALCSYSILHIHETKQLFEHNSQCSGTVNRMGNNGYYLYTLTSLNQYVASIKPGAPYKMAIKSY